MTNKENTNRLFGHPASHDIRLEEKIMKEYKRKHTKRTIAMAALICFAVLQAEAALRSQSWRHSAHDPALDSW